MLVNHNESEATNAVITANQTQSMGMSDTPEFYAILSGALYSNQLLAVVREVICNAWDAHIDANKEDVPIEIVLTENEFIVKDFGSGIPPEHFVGIYGVYGYSPKKNDSRATGGFGLGCKAPFSYTESFQVINSYKEHTSLYVCNKSSIEVEGKPSINLITKIPRVAETGVTVKIPIKVGDKKTIQEYIREIVYLGGIKALYNSSLNLPTIKFDTFYAIAEDPAAPFSKQPLFVKYGTVTYPIKEKSEYKQLWNEAEKICKRISGHFNAYPTTVYILAENSILSIAPSREELTYTPKTIKEITKLLKKFIDDFKNKLDEPIKEELNLIKRKANEGNLKIFFKIFAPFTHLEYKNNKTIYEKYAVSFNSENTKQLKEVIKNKIRLIPVYFTNINKQTIENYLKYLENKNNFAFFKWVVKTVYNPLIKSDLINIDKLYIKANGSNDKKHSSGLIPLRYIKENNLVKHSTLHILKKVIVISYGSFSVLKRLESFSINNTYYNTDCFLFLTLKRKTDNPKQIKEFLESKNYTVLDLTYRHECEPIPKKRIYEPKSEKPKTIGLPLLNVGVNEEGSFSYSKFEENVPNYQRIESPLFYVNSNSNLNLLSKDITLIINNMFGNKAVFAKTDKIQNKLEEKSVQNITTFLPNYLLEYLKNNKEFAKYYRKLPIVKLNNYVVNLHNSKKLNTSYITNSKVRLLKTILKSKDLLKYFNITKPNYTLTKEEEDITKLINEVILFSDKYLKFFSESDKKELSDFCFKIKLSAGTKNKLNNFFNNQQLNLIDLSELNNNIIGNSNTLFIHSIFKQLTK